MKHVSIDVYKDKGHGRFIVRDAHKEKHLVQWETAVEGGITIIKFVSKPLLSTRIESEAFMPCYLKRATGERFFKFAFMLPQIMITV